MFSNKEKATLILAGVGLVGCLVMGVYTYGRMKFYEGRISKYDELKPIMDTLSDELKKQLLKNKEAE